MCGQRGKKDQDIAVASGASKDPWPTSRHNSDPSEAIDVAPVVDGKIPWNDTGAFYMLIGVFRAEAVRLGIKIRCGADWNSNWTTKDQRFNDLGHIEIVAEPQRNV